MLLDFPSCLSCSLACSALNACLNLMILMHDLSTVHALLNSLNWHCDTWLFPSLTEIIPLIEPEAQDPDPGSIEDIARELFLQPQPPSKQQILELFYKMPRALLRRMGGGDGVSNVLFVVGGPNPRSASYLLNLCDSHPYFVKVVNRYLRAVSPLHKYSTFTIRRGCSCLVHRDLRNGPCPSLVLSLSEGNPGDGLWLHDKLGTVYKRYLSQDLPGVVVPLQAPFRFDARKVLHAGHVGDPLLAHDRVVLVAFTTLTARFVEPRVYATLVELGFPLPSPYQPPRTDVCRTMLALETTLDSGSFQSRRHFICPLW